MNKGMNGFQLKVLGVVTWYSITLRSFFYF